MPKQDAPVEIVNAQTGEIRRVPLGLQKRMQPPKPATVTELKIIAGENPLAVNLKDNPQLAGKQLTIKSVVWKTENRDGTGKPFIVADAFVTEPGIEPTPENYILLMTGAELIVNRLGDAELAAEGGSPYPVRGILHMSTRGTWSIV